MLGIRKVDNRKKSLNVGKGMISQEKDTLLKASQSKDSDDPKINLIPSIYELEEQDNIEVKYEEFSLPITMRDTLIQTVTSVYPIFKEKHSYKITFSPEAIKGLRDGTFTLVERKDRNGFLPILNNRDTSKFVEQGVLYKDVSPSLLINGSMNLLTAAVGQKQLANIQKSLDSIEQKLDTLMLNRKNDYMGRIKSREIYFREVIRRSVMGVSTMRGVEDIQIESSYVQTLEDMCKVNEDLKSIVSKIELIKESEKIRKYKVASFNQSIAPLIKDFNELQQILELNFRYIKENYEPYLSLIRKYDPRQIEDTSLKVIEEENDLLIQRVHEKIERLNRNYKIHVGINKKEYHMKNMEQINEIIPRRLEYNTPIKEIPPKEVIMGVDETGKVFAYLPR